MPTGKLLIFFGLVLIVAGLFITFGDKLYFLGKIPGDIRIERENFTFFFPFGTCILVSLLLSLTLWLLRR
ncbi:MAG: DUF2905 domain-containing protein [Deltaproteobacteria bacterium]|nr:DUF2905 domain-containing protein [Deltaproteobacteria bacterium]